MAKNTPVWFRNNLTGAVTAVKPGTPEHRRLVSELTNDEDNPERVWTPIEPAKGKAVKYASGARGTVHVHNGKPVRAQGDDPDAAPEPPAEPQK